uniref:Uncharacterized protein n=1 Tax=Macaca fascicularis TaxID=9541 RepID=A0A7N9CTP1_MACFA
LWYRIDLVQKSSRPVSFLFRGKLGLLSCSLCTCSLFILLISSISLKTNGVS